MNIEYISKKLREQDVRIYKQQNRIEKKCALTYEKGTVGLK